MKKYKSFFTLTAAVVLLSYSCNVDDDSNSSYFILNPEIKKNMVQNKEYTLSSYGYYFYETTGSNKFINIDGKELSIRWNRMISNQTALSSLESLKWKIIYPNSKGNIKILGYYNKTSHDFILIHWYLKAPFFVFEGEEGLDQEINRFPKEKLELDDFSLPINVAPELFNREFKIEDFN